MILLLCVPVNPQFTGGTTKASRLFVAHCAEFTVSTESRHGKLKKKIQDSASSFSIFAPPHRQGLLHFKTTLLCYCA